MKLEEKKSKIFLGDIYEVVNSDDMDNIKEDCERGTPIPFTSMSITTERELKKEKAILVKIEEGKYVKLEDWLDPRKKNKIEEIILPDSDFLLSKGDLFVDSKSIKPVFKKEETLQKEDIKLSLDELLERKRSLMIKRNASAYFAIANVIMVGANLDVMLNQTNGKVMHGLCSLAVLGCTVCSALDLQETINKNNELKETKKQIKVLKKR